MKSKLENAHTAMVADLFKPGEDIKNEMTPERWDLLMRACRQYLEAAQYLDQVKKLVMYNKGAELIPSRGFPVPSLSSEMFELIHAAVGIAGEAGEIMETVFVAINEGEFDVDNVSEEFGDMEFYMEAFRMKAPFPMTRNETLEHNIHKLVKSPKARYKDGYSDKAAQDRVDKK
jgi:NTP pyrophosphatase (non-canonical NTP hydrolase)